MGVRTKGALGSGLNRYGQGIGVGSGTVPTPTQSLLPRIKKIILDIAEMSPVVYGSHKMRLLRLRIKDRYALLHTTVHVL